MLQIALRSTLILGGLLFSVPVVAEKEARACVDSKVRALGEALRCHLSEGADHSQSETPFGDDSCSTRLERRLTLAENRYGDACPTLGDSERLPPWTAELSQRVVQSIDGTNPSVDYDTYMAERGPGDPDPRVHMLALVEYTKQNLAAARAFCASQQPPVSPPECSRGVPFCALVVDRKTDAVVARACNHGSTNPVLHGEIAVINAVANVFQAQGIPFRAVAQHHDLYTTGESCAMCAGAIMWAGFNSVFFGSTVEYLGNYYSQIQISNRELAGLWTECREREAVVRTRVVGPVLEPENNALFDDFGVPFCPAATTSHAALHP